MTFIKTKQFRRSRLCFYAKAKAEPKTFLKKLPMSCNSRLNILICNTHEKVFSAQFMYSDFSVHSSRILRNSLVLSQVHTENGRPNSTNYLNSLFLYLHLQKETVLAKLNRFSL